MPAANKHNWGFPGTVLNITDEERPGEFRGMHDSSGPAEISEATRGYFRENPLGSLGCGSQTVLQKGFQVLKQERKGPAPGPSLQPQRCPSPAGDTGNLSLYWISLGKNSSTAKKQIKGTLKLVSSLGFLTSLALVFSSTKWS